MNTGVKIVNVKTVVIQPSSGDAYVDEGTPDLNYGGENEIEIRSYALSPRNARGFVKFDLSRIPAKSEIISAKLFIYMYIAPTASRVYYAQMVTSTWDELTITWSNQPAATSVHQASTQTGTTDKVWLSWDVTDIVKLWHSGKALNHGFRIVDGNENSEKFQVAYLWSRDIVYVEYHPKLEVTYGFPASSAAPTLCVMIKVCIASIKLMDCFKVASQIDL
jgi:hypothetical protein